MTPKIRHLKANEAGPWGERGAEWSTKLLTRAEEVYIGNGVLTEIFKESEPEPIVEQVEEPALVSAPAKKTAAKKTTAKKASAKLDLSDTQDIEAVTDED